MPFAIDTEKLESPNMKILDMGNPPLKSIAHQEYPKMVYLHPKDKAKEHRTKIVANAEELEEAESKGWRMQPHIPSRPAEDLSVDFEAEAPEEVRRGPGRPRAAA
jgi:hypothetical protein